MDNSSTVYDGRCFHNRKTKSQVNICWNVKLRRNVVCQKICWILLIIFIILLFSIKWHKFKYFRMIFFCAKREKITEYLWKQYMQYRPFSKIKYFYLHIHSGDWDPVRTNGTCIYTIRTLPLCIISSRGRFSPCHGWGLWHFCTSILLWKVLSIYDLDFN